MRALATLPVSLLAAGLAVAASLGAAAAKDPISVTMDRAKVMRISAPADTVIIGNPAIADATMHDRQTLVITGKMAGITNLVILDAKGHPIADEIINVEKIQQGLVTVQRGPNRTSYFCTPNCNSMAEPGDSTESFGAAMSQLTARSTMSTGGTPAQ